MLGQGKKYYESVFGEAEIVATAYSNFGNRVSKVKHKLTAPSPFSPHSNINYLSVLACAQSKLPRGLPSKSLQGSFGASPHYTSRWYLKVAVR